METVNQNFEFIDENDTFEIYSDCVIGSAELEVVFRLYQPLISYMSCALYTTLLMYCDVLKKEQKTIAIKHKLLFDVMQITPNNFLHARKSLEASGLLKTYQEKVKSINKYRYVLYAPRMAKDFLEHRLFCSQLIKYLGIQTVKEISKYYKKDYSENILTHHFKDISANFNDVFNPDLDNVYSGDVDLMSNKPIEINTSFSWSDFFLKLKENNINENALSKKECKEIERLACLYSLTASELGEIIVQIYDENQQKGNRINIAILNRKTREIAKFSITESKIVKNKKFIKIGGKTELLDEITQMEKLSPKMYLQLKQDNTPPTTPDLNLINYLSSFVRLNNAVINAIIWFTLKKCDGSLNRLYIEKIAGALKRKKIVSATDVIQYLTRKPTLENNDEFHEINGYNDNKNKKNDDFNIEEAKKLVEEIEKGEFE